MFNDQRELNSVFHRIGGALLLYIALYNFLMFPTEWIQQFFTTSFPVSTVVYVITDLLSSLAYAVSFIFPTIFFYILSKNAKSKPIDFTLRLSENGEVFNTLTIVFLGTAICLSCSFVNSILFPLPENAYKLLNATGFDKGYKLVLAFISTAIIPAFVEELLFRGVIISNLRPYSESGAIIISAILFGFMHQTPYQFFYTTAVGIVLGIVYVKTKSIWSGVLLHFFNNFFSIVQTYLLQLYDAKIGNLIYNILQCTVIGIGIVMGTLFYFTSLKKKKKDTFPSLGIYGKYDDTYINRPKAIHMELIKAFLSPTIITFVLLCVINMIYNAVLLYGV